MNPVQCIQREKTGSSLPMLTGNCRVTEEIYANRSPISSFPQPIVQNSGDQHDASRAVARSHRWLGYELGDALHESNLDVNQPAGPPSALELVIMFAPVCRFPSSPFLSNRVVKT